MGILFCAYTVAKVQRDSIFLSEFGALGFEYEPGRTKQDLTTHGPILGGTVHF